MDSPDHLQTLTVSRTAMLLTVLCIFAVSCSRPYRVIYKADSPDLGSSVVIQLSYRPPLPGGGYEVVLKRHEESRVLYRYEASDVYACFAEIGWSPDSSMVGVLVRDCWHSSVLLAFDGASGKALNPLRTRSYLRDALRLHYALPVSVADPIAWAMNSEEARRSFRMSK